MFGSLGGPEIILIFVVALLVFGPRKLPEIGRKVGQLARELRRATGDFRSNLEREIGFDPVSGIEKAHRARREILSTVSEPLKEVAQETIGTAQQARERAARFLSDAVADDGPETGEGAQAASDERSPDSTRGAGAAGAAREPAEEGETGAPSREGETGAPSREGETGAPSREGETGAPSRQGSPASDHRDTPPDRSPGDAEA